MSHGGCMDPSRWKKRGNVCYIKILLALDFSGVGWSDTRAGVGVAARTLPVVFY